MNEAPNTNQTSGLNDTFSSQPASQTNPFTADLKGEFTSNFGTNTNAVSQIFKEGGFVNQNRTKYLIIGGAVILILGLVFFMLTGEDSSDEFGEDLAGGEDTISAEEETGDSMPGEKVESVAAETPAAPAATESAATAAATPAPAAAPAASANSGMVGGGPISLGEPASGSSVAYDETQGAAVFTWTGGGGHIVFSRNSSMHPVVRRVRVSGNSYAFQNPWPGTWYWKVQNSSGGSEVRSFTVSAPQRRNIQVSEPAAGAPVAGSGGVVSWQGDGSIAYYRVELSNGSWANPSYKFATSGNSVQLSGVAAGQYQMRIGAFSEVSGRWEYTSPQAVTVQ